MIINKHNQSLHTSRGKLIIFLALALIIVDCKQLLAQSKSELKQRIIQLENKLAATQAELKEVKANVAYGQEEIRENNPEQNDNINNPAPNKTRPNDSWLDSFKIGGSMRTNYVVGDYGGKTGMPSRDFSDGGNFLFETISLKLDYKNGPYIGKLEYRFYDGYHMLHTGWLGYNFKDDSQVQLGVSRVPFGSGDYGTSQSWFFDQNFYVGLADDMDLGIKYLKSIGKLDMDFAYYYSDEGSYAGDTKNSARYSYDIVNETGSGYEERNQFNFRGIYNIEGTVNTALGTSLQYGQLDSKGPQDDGSHFAGSVHMINKWNNWTLASQLTYYKYDIDEHDVTSGVVGTDKLIDMGAYDFAWPVASEAWIPAVSLSYYYETTEIDWVDYVIPYIEYSSIIKTENEFNDSDLFSLGMAWARGGWYILTDLGLSNGNYFVGSDGDDYGINEVGDFGTNGNDRWNTRININLAYYF